jgi:hypothetical protein
MARMATRKVKITQAGDDAVDDPDDVTKRDPKKVWDAHHGQGTLLTISGTLDPTFDDASTLTSWVTDIQGNLVGGGIGTPTGDHTWSFDYDGLPGNVPLHITVQYLTADDSGKVKDFGFHATKIRRLFT